jgi:hypothetical protein
MGSNTAAIETFFQHFEDVLHNIHRLSAGRHTETFQKLLCVSVIDTLSKCAYPKMRSGKHRFTCFVRAFGGWAEHSRVSLPELRRFLLSKNSDDYGRLKQLVDSKMANWSDGRTIYLDQDPQFEEVLELWPLKPKQLERFQHLQLLYTYRNTLVHELRRTGRGFDFSDDRPFYHTLQELDTGRVAWELSYSVGFFESLTSSCLGNVKKEFMSADRDPHESFDLEGAWVK